MANSTIVQVEIRQKILNDLRSGVPQAKADLIHSFADFKKAVTNVMEEDGRVTNYFVANFLYFFSCIKSFKVTYSFSK